MFARLLVTLFLTTVAVLSQISAGGGGVSGPAIRRTGPPQAAPPQYKPEELCTISGIVRDDASGEPLRKAQVQLVPAQPRGPWDPVSATSLADGKFTLTNVEPGEYRLMAVRAGYVNSLFGSTARRGQGTVLKLDKAQKVSDVEIRLVPHAVITGKVIDEDGDPVMNAHVQLMRFRYTPGGRQLLPDAGAASTNDLGEYRIFGVPPGKYCLSVNQRGGFGPEGGGAVRTDASGAEEGYASTYYPGVTDPASAMQIEVGQGRNLQGVDVKLLRTRTYRVTGQVVLPGGRAQGGMVMLARRDFGIGFFFDRHSAPFRGPDGKFVIRGVQPGSYTVVAMYNEGETRLSARANVDVANANADAGVLQLSVGPEVNGSIRVDGDTQASLDQLRVFLRPGDGQPTFAENTTATVKPDGTFVIRNAPRSKVGVMVQGLPEGFYLKSARLGESDALEGEADISAAGGAALELVLSPRAAQLQGTVIASKGTPAPAATVFLIPVAENKRKRTEAWGRTQSDQTGAFTMRNVTPGEYYLLAAIDFEPGEEMDPEFLKQREKSAERLDLKESAVETRQLKLP